MSVEVSSSSQVAVLSIGKKKLRSIKLSMNSILIIKIAKYFSVIGQILGVSDGSPLLPPSYSFQISIHPSLNAQTLSHITPLAIISFLPLFLSSDCRSWV